MSNNDRVTTRRAARHGVVAFLRCFTLWACLAWLFVPTSAQAQFVFTTSGADTTEVLNYEWVPAVFQSRPSLQAGFDTLGRFAVGDLDADGNVEIVFNRSTASGGRLHVFTYNRASQAYLDRGAFDFVGFDLAEGQLTIGDIDGDKRDEVIVTPAGSADPAPRPLGGGIDSVFILRFSNLAPLQAQAFELVDQFITPITSVLAADFSGDGIDELAFLTQNLDAASSDSEPLGAGTLFICSPVLGSSTTCPLVNEFTVAASPTNGRFPTSLALGDITGDNVSELVIGYGSGCPASLDNGVRVFESASGETYHTLEAKLQTIAIADYDGDGLDELTVIYGGQGEPGVLTAVRTYRLRVVTPSPFFEPKDTIIPLPPLPGGLFCSQGVPPSGVTFKPPAYVAVTSPTDVCNGVDDDGDGVVDEDAAGAPLRAKSCSKSAFCATPAGAASTCCSAPDTDGDGLEDFIEASKQIDLDCNGTVDVNLPAGVDPNHKDLLLELDWQADIGTATAKPSFRVVQLVKDAFARAPVDAGGIPNPDGQYGINLWVDTGNLTDPNNPSQLVGDPMGGGNEIAPFFMTGIDDGRFAPVRNANFQPGREVYFRYGVYAHPPHLDALNGEAGPGAPGDCNDGMDNDGDGKPDASDSYCQVDRGNGEDGAGPGTCTDGIDNAGLADGADSVDSECMVPLEKAGVPDSCFNGFDDDSNMLIDGADPACAAAGIPSEFGPGVVDDSCTDGADNGDGDALADEQDPQCAGLPSEDGAPFGSCWDGKDNVEPTDGADGDCVFPGGVTGNLGFLLFDTDPIAFMHEFGHSLGLHHGGPYRVGGVVVDNNVINCKPPYVSIMNYDHRRGIPQGHDPTWQEGTAGLGSCSDGIDNDGDGAIDAFDKDSCRGGDDLDGDGTTDAAILDFSPPRIFGGYARNPDPLLFSIDEANLSETSFLDPNDWHNQLTYLNARGEKWSSALDGYTPKMLESGMPGPAGSQCGNGLDDDVDTFPDLFDPQCHAYDYDDNNALTPGSIRVNVNGADANGQPAACASNTSSDEVLYGANDWLHILTTTTVPGFVPPHPDRDPTMRETIEAEQRRQADLQVRFTTGSMSVPQGTQTTLDLEVVNRGPYPAEGARVAFSGSSGTVLDVIDPRCVLNMGSVECDLEGLDAHQLTTISVAVTSTATSIGAFRTVDALARSARHDRFLANNSDSVTVYSAPGFTSFDDPSDWTTNNCTLSSNANATQGEASLEIGCCGYRALASASFNTTEFEIISDQLSLDVFVPSNVSNPWWIGDVQLRFESIPSGAYNVGLGQALLNNLPRGTWSTLVFQVPPQVRAVIESDTARSQFSVIVNTSLCGEHLLVDNLRFTGNTEPRSNLHQPPGGQGVISESILTFDTPGDWTSNDSVLSWVSDPNSQGSAALLVDTSGSSQLVSRTFDTSELSVVTARMSVDVLADGPPPNPYWIGDAQLHVSCPSAQLYNVYLGRAELTAVFFGEYNAVEFDIPLAVQSVLSGSYSDCFFRLGLTGTPAPEGYYIDNMGFVE
jgi:hypothetical protein